MVATLSVRATVCQLDRVPWVPPLVKIRVRMGINPMRTTFLICNLGTLRLEATAGVRITTFLAVKS